MDKPKLTKAQHEVLAMVAERTKSKLPYRCVVNYKPAVRLVGLGFIQATGGDEFRKSYVVTPAGLEVLGVKP